VLELKVDSNDREADLRLSGGDDFQFRDNAEGNRYVALLIFPGDPPARRAVIRRSPLRSAETAV
jgi:hypothetical protein